MSTPTASSPLHTLTSALEGLSALDAPGRMIGERVRGVAGTGPVKDALSGAALGHAIHPVLTDVVIGAWTSANLLDLLGGRASEQAAERLIAIGIAAYGPTALTGFSDWSDTEERDAGVRRVGLIHAWTNATGLALYTASLLARRRGDRGKGVALALAGAGAISAGGFLGGHLSAARGNGLASTPGGAATPRQATA